MYCMYIDVYVDVYVCMYVCRCVCMYTLMSGAPIDVYVCITR